MEFAGSLVEIRKQYISSLEENTRALKNALVHLERESDNRDEIFKILRIAQHFRGTGAIYGYPNITASFAELTDYLKKVSDKKNLSADEIYSLNQIINGLIVSAGSLEDGEAQGREFLQFPEEKEVNRGSIFVIDDDPNALRIMCSLLEHCGYHVKYSNNAEDVLSKGFGLALDLILLDHHMPGMDAVDFIRKVKSIRGLELFKIIIVSGMVTDGREVVTALEMGADDYLSKPFHLEELFARVKNQMRIKRMEEALLAKGLECKTLSVKLDEQVRVSQGHNHILQKHIEELNQQKDRLAEYNRQLKKKKITIRTLSIALVIILVTFVMAFAIGNVEKFVKSIYTYSDSDVSV
jgi:DNA-binding response OmpR family regulator